MIQRGHGYTGYSIKAMILKKQSTDNFCRYDHSSPSSRRQNPVCVFFQGTTRFCRH